MVGWGGLPSGRTPTPVAEICRAPTHAPSGGRWSAIGEAKRNPLHQPTRFWQVRLDGEAAGLSRPPTSRLLPLPEPLGRLAHQRAVVSQRLARDHGDPAGHG